MTAQIPDTFLYRSEEYELVALDGEGLRKRNRLC